MMKMTMMMMIPLDHGVVDWTAVREEKGVAEVFHLRLSITIIFKIIYYDYLFQSLATCHDILDNHKICDNENSNEVAEAFHLR